MAKKRGGGFSVPKRGAKSITWTSGGMTTSVSSSGRITRKPDMPGAIPGMSRSKKYRSKK